MKICFIATLFVVLSCSGVSPYHRYERDVNHDLLEAIKEGDEIEAKMLLENGANANTTDGESPMKWASANSNVHVSELLIKNGSVINVKDNDGLTPLHLATQNCDTNVAELLIKKGAHISETDNKGYTPLHWAAKNGNIKVVKLLIKNGAVIGKEDNDGSTPLHMAAMFDKPDVATFLLVKGAGVNVIDNIGLTPQHWAASNGSFKVAVLLIEHDANIHKKSKDGRTPLFAVEKGNAAIVQLLIERGAIVSEKDNEGLTPLHLAAREGHVNIGLLLIKNGAKIDEPADNEWTPLHFAASNGHPDVVLLLIEKGGKIDQKNKDGRTAIDLAIMHGQLDVVNLLEKYQKGSYIGRLDPWVIAAISIVAFLIVEISLIVSVIVLSLLWLRGRRERQRLNKLIVNFKNGDPSKINVNLPLEEQADLLPYDEKFEFPKDNLKLGKRLGAGAFGVVYEATARNILRNGTKSRVAVKEAKNSIDFEVVEALTKELKLMTHLGQHINLVNLLGAITKNLKKRELMIIIEYCPLGNVRDFLRNNYFINQIKRDIDKIDVTITQRIDHSKSSREQSDCSAGCVGYVDIHQFNANNSQANANSDIELQPLQSTKRTFTTMDLLCWAFQVAKGMQYLGDKKVVHGDLAARNILLCEGNVVKICDFGLARSLYLTDFYCKFRESAKEPLPLKWVAPETMKYQLLSPYSDVWSYGIVLWEFFSIGMEPYTGMELEPAEFRSTIERGYRMEKPEYATQEIYKLMSYCWKYDPVERPSFRALEKLISTLAGGDLQQYYTSI